MGVVNPSEIHVGGEGYLYPLFVTGRTAMNRQERDARRALQIIARFAHSQDVTEEGVAELIALGEPALAALDEAAATSHPASQRIAAIVLSRMDTRRALAPMLNTAARVRDQPDLVASLLHAAAQLLEPRDKERVRPFLLRCLQHDDTSVRLAAVECARATGDQDVLGVIVGAHNDAATVVMAGPASFLQQPRSDMQATVPRAASMSLISALGARSETERRDARSQLLRHPDRDRVIIEHLHHADAYIRRSVLEVAAIAGPTTLHKALLDIAVEAERSEHERALALRGVQRIAADGSEDAIIQQLLRQPDLYVRAEAGRLAVTSDKEALVSLAMRMLEDDEPWVRKRIAEGWSGSTSAARQRDLPVVTELLVHAQWLQRPTMLDIEAYQAITGGIMRLVELGGFIDSAMLDELAILRTQRTPEVGDVTRRLLESLSQRTGLLCASDRTELEIQALYADAPEERERALRALSEESETTLRREIPTLIRFLYSATVEETILVTRILRGMRDRRAAEALSRMLNHPNERVREAASGADRADPPA